VADLSVLWVETAIAPDELSFVQEGQEAVVKGSNKQDAGKLIFVSPVIDPDTRSAKAIIEIQNADGKWRSGDYATALIATSQQEAAAIVPKDAIQTMEGKPYAFVKTAEGFEKREVRIGRTDSQNIEVTSGLKAGEAVATSNTFTLKAEAGKSEAEHSH
jgi:cobalt-zinc-cadmium efflux system membrane fusion protein